MILKEFYTQKKNALDLEFDALFEINPLSVAYSKPVVHLYNDTVFNEPVTNPIVMFKYDSIHWESSSEKTYKADVTFSFTIVLPKVAISNFNVYETAFDIAERIDKVVLSNNINSSFIDTNSTFKVHEKQCINTNVAYWNKNDFFIWEISYKTTLIENSLKKKYILITNGVPQDDIEKLGYDFDTDFQDVNDEVLVDGQLYINANIANKIGSTYQAEASILSDEDIDNNDLSDSTNPITLEANGINVNEENVDIEHNREIKAVKI